MGDIFKGSFLESLQNVDSEAFSFSSNPRDFFKGSFQVQWGYAFHEFSWSSCTGAAALLAAAKSVESRVATFMYIFGSSDVNPFRNIANVFANNNVCFSESYTGWYVDLTGVFHVAVVA